MQLNPSENSHVSSALSQTSNPAAHPEIDPKAFSISGLIPPAVLERKFRGHSFAAKLNPIQHATLFTWLRTYSVREVVEKVAAPAPDGFGLAVSPTTLDRLKLLSHNSPSIARSIEALDTASDILESGETHSLPALQQALRVMLYSAAVDYAARGAEPKVIDQTLAALARLQKLQMLDAPPHSANLPPSIPATRHHVHLTISPAPLDATKPAIEIKTA